MDEFKLIICKEFHMPLTYLISSFRRLGRRDPLLHGTYLQQRPERDAADGTVVGLVPQRLGAPVAEAQVPARQNQRVPRVGHADDALGARVLVVARAVGHDAGRGLAVRVRRAAQPVKRRVELVLDSVDFLEQVAQAVDEELLFEALEPERAVREFLDDRDCCLGLTRLCEFESKPAL
jgi:hypothetical protein